MRNPDLYEDDEDPDSPWDTDLPEVAAPSSMDDSTFIKHFNARHNGRLEERGQWPQSMANHRVVHRREHESAVQGHTHRPGSQPWQDPKEG